MDAAGHAKTTPSNYPPPPPDNEAVTAASRTQDLPPSLARRSKNPQIPRPILSPPSHVPCRQPQRWLLRLAVLSPRHPFETAMKTDQQAPTWSGRQRLSQ
ncbi:hypothetical protein HGRIS_001280 [Hohenbuehelia grisea]|uniref:Uncharacterized protein n=1 Tax=Hohenbuehelia grisea TaxID=104357 RepID=A0ABR3JPW5_9AGAR